MGLGAAIGGIVGGISSSRGSRRAADAQAEAARAQTALEQRIYEETTDRFEPFYQDGLDFQNALRFELLGGNAPVFGATYPEVVRRGDRHWDVNGQRFRNEADAQAFADANSMPGYEYQGFKATPGYQFALEQGQAAIDGSAAARGNVFSGATLKAQQEYGTGLANQEYNNFLNRLTGQASQGQAAAGNIANAGANYASGAGNALANMGNAQAAGYIGQANAINSGINNAIGAFGYMNSNTLRASNGITVPQNLMSQVQGLF